MQDALAEEVAARGRQANLSFFAFTATPKAPHAGAVRPARTRTAGIAPFDLYSMRQAIEEGFILDVLANYTTYETYFKIDKAITDDPELDQARAKAAIARFVSLHEHNLAQRADVIVNHFRDHVAKRIGGKAKAMVVTASRLHALRYKQALDRYCAEHGIGDVNTLVAFSGTVGDRRRDVHRVERQRVPRLPDPAAVRHRRLADPGRGGEVPDRLRPAEAVRDVRRQDPVSGLAAVQTLSRLNRIHPQKTGTFVLDFRNIARGHPGGVRAVVRPDRRPATDPHLLYDTHAELDRFGVLVYDEVETFVRLLLEDPEKNHARINGVLSPAVDRFNALDAGDAGRVP